MSSVKRNISCTPKGSHDGSAKANASGVSATNDSSAKRALPRPRTSPTTYFNGGEHQIICAVTESRGVSTTVGLACLNISTSQAALCQITDNQTYTRTIHKLFVWEPTVLLLPSTAMEPPSKLAMFLDAHQDIGATPIGINRKYFSETEGWELLNQLALRDELEPLKVATEGNFYAVSCISAVLQYVANQFDISYATHTLRIRSEVSEGSMMIDLSTIRSLELIQNIRDTRSKHCLLGLLDETLTSMGSRLLRSNILQPLVDPETLQRRLDAIEEFTTREDIFVSVRKTLRGFLDVDRALTNIVVIPGDAQRRGWLEQSINHILILKQFIRSIVPVFDSLQNVRRQGSDALLQKISDNLNIAQYADVISAIDASINEDTAFSRKPLELRNQRMYAVKSGVNGLLDVARQAYKETNEDVHDHCREMAQLHELSLELSYENKRGYFMRFPAHEIQNKDPDLSIFINITKRKKVIECQTMDLLKLNNKMACSHQEVMNMSLETIQTLIEQIRSQVAPLFKISDSLALLDMLSSLAQVATKFDYVKPQFGSTLVLRAARHPIRIKISTDKFIPNDYHAAENSRLQIITGCNMSGKSTYIRAIALLQVMAQIGSFVPATRACFMISRQLFARVSTDDNISANVSTFAAEMREVAFILKNITRHSLVIIDELGRGTSTTDGLAIAIAIAEALLKSKCLVWFVTHFHELARFLAPQPGVANMHLASEVKRDADSVVMLYQIASGPVKEPSYGVELASVACLPDKIIDKAKRVSAVLREKKRVYEDDSVAGVQAKKRKLLLGLRDQLLFAKESSMKGKFLKEWLSDLQDEFVIRMDSLEAAENKIRARSPLILDSRTASSESSMLEDVPTPETSPQSIYISKADEAPPFSNSPNRYEDMKRRSLKRKANQKVYRITGTEASNTSKHLDPRVAGAESKHRPASREDKCYSGPRELPQAGSNSQQYERTTDMKSTSCASDTSEALGLDRQSRISNTASSRVHGDSNSSTLQTQHVKKNIIHPTRKDHGGPYLMSGALHPNEKAFLLEAGLLESDSSLSDTGASSSADPDRSNETSDLTTDSCVRTFVTPATPELRPEDDGSDDEDGGVSIANMLLTEDEGDQADWEALMTFPDQPTHAPERGPVPGSDPSLRTSSGSGSVFTDLSSGNRKS